MVFLNVDDELGAFDLRFRTCKLSLEFDDTQIAFVDLSRLGSALLRREPSQFAALSQRTPRRQMRRIQAFPSEKSPDLTRLRAAVRLLQNLALVLGGESPSSALTEYP